LYEKLLSDGLQELLTKLNGVNRIRAAFQFYNDLPDEEKV